MAKKREIPLFTFDLTRAHGMGEVDFITCTDIESGFLARIDILSPAEAASVETDHVTTKLLTNEVTGYGALITIVRATGTRPSDTKYRSLLKRAADKYTELTTRKVNTSAPTPADMLHFIAALTKDVTMGIEQSGSDYDQRRTLTTYKEMLEGITDYITNKEG